MRRVIAIAGLLGSTLGLGACDRQQDSPCPPCDCQDQGQGQGQDGPRPAAASPGDLGELVALANRKLNHGDGPGCLAELERVRAIDPKLDAQMLLLRAQCEMAAGECQTGKQAIADYYVRELAMTRGRADQTAESMAAMRCKGGDASERDRLLAAYFDLSDGAYMNERDVEFCRDRIAIVEELAPKVQPRDVQDTQISGSRQAMFHTGAMCFAQAGDCKAAYAHFRRWFPPEGLTAIQDAEQREAMVRETFESSIELCKSSLELEAPN